MVARLPPLTEQDDGCIFRWQCMEKKQTKNLPNENNYVKNTIIIYDDSSKKMKIVRMC